VPLIVLRHASAGDRSVRHGDDRERPLDARGAAQALSLVELLMGFPIDEILSSPYRRCLETVAPLARARELEVSSHAELGEERQFSAGIALVRSLRSRDVLVCGHGGLESSLLDPPKWHKGEAFVVGDDLRVSATIFPKVKIA
jgi:phosphohistidine phosphatase SixA